jgi:hypothetical protein
MMLFDDPVCGQQSVGGRAVNMNEERLISCRSQSLEMLPDLAALLFEGEIQDWPPHRGSIQKRFSSGDSEC